MLHSCTFANIYAVVLGKGLTNQIAGQGKDSKATLGLSRPMGLFRQPSVGSPSLSSPWPGSLPPLQPPKVEPSTELG